MTRLLSSSLQRRKADIETLSSCPQKRIAKELDPLNLSLEEDQNGQGSLLLFCFWAMFSLLLTKATEGNALSFSLSNTRMWREESPPLSGRGTQAV